MEYKTLPEKHGYYQTNLNFTESTYANILQNIYAMETTKNNPYSSDSRTFHLHKGFHSCNLLEGDILKKFTHLSLAVSRVQELLYNYFSTKYIDFNKTPNAYLHITEIWFNILRRGDANMPHSHPNCHVSGNFYLQVPPPESRLHNLDGALVFIKTDNHNFYLPFSVGSQEGQANIIKPSVGHGILFQSHEKHVVLPHFSDTDRIGLAFNAVCVQRPGVYRSLKPTPYWMPSRLWIHLTDKERVQQTDGEKDLLLIVLPNKQTLQVPVSKGLVLDPDTTKNITVGFECLQQFRQPKYYAPHVRDCFEQDNSKQKKT